MISRAKGPPTHDLVVSIVNYRTGDMTCDCLASVLADLDATPGLAAHVMVVDNASGDGSAKVIADWIADRGVEDRVTLIRSVRNTGFSGGHNQGIKAADGAFYLVLNSDAMLRPGFCDAILAAARAQPEAGLFAPRIEHEDGVQQTSCFRVHSPASELIRAAGTGLVRRLFARRDVPLDMPPAPEQIGWASFAGILLRRTMIDAIGPMDDGYFLYFEDTEYCLRARRAGWTIAYVPEARFVHFRGGSAPVKALAQARKRLPRYYYASRTRLLYQAHGRSGLLAANLMWHLGRVIAHSRRLLGRSAPQASAREWRDIWINFTDPLGDSGKPKDG